MKQEITVPMINVYASADVAMVSAYANPEVEIYGELIVGDNDYPWNAAHLFDVNGNYVKDANGEYILVQI